MCSKEINFLGNLIYLSWQFDANTWLLLNTAEWSETITFTVSRYQKIVFKHLLVKVFPVLLLKGEISSLKLALTEIEVMCWTQLLFPVVVISWFCTGRPPSSFCSFYSQIWSVQVTSTGKSLCSLTHQTHLFFVLVGQRLVINLELSETKLLVNM